MKSSIANENEKTLFFKYLIPSMLSMLAVSAYSFVDTFVVGQAIGAQAVAAMGLGTPVVSILYALGFLCGSGGAVNYSVTMGVGKKEKARYIFSCSFIVTLLLWLVLAVFGNIFINDLAVFLGATSRNIDLTIEYLRWIISLSGFLIMDLVMNNFMRNEGHPNVSMVATVTGTGLNIILDFLFVMGFKWGMSGAASATCLASIVSVCINLGCAFGKRTNLIPKFNMKAFVNLGNMVTVGFGAFVLEGAVALISVVFLNFAGRYYGDDGVSAFSVLITFNLIVYSLLNGVAQSIQPLISANYGTGREDRIQKFLKYGMITAITVGSFFFAIAELIPKQLVNLLVSDSDTIKTLAQNGLQYYAVSFIFMAVSIVVGIYFQAKTKSVEALAILLGRSAALPILIVYVLAFWMNGLNLWIAIPIGEGMAMILSFVLLLVEKRKSIKK